MNVTTRVRSDWYAHELVHQADVIFEHLGDADWERRRSDVCGSMRFGAFNAAFDLADVVEIFTEARAIARPQIPLQHPGLSRDEIENAFRSPVPRLPLRSSAWAPEHALEHDPGVDLHRQRRRRRAPGDRVRVRATESAGARADIAGEVGRGQLEGREGRVLADLFRDDLIDAGAGVNVFGFGPLRIDARQPA
jgi:hypothetical protein